LLPGVLLDKRSEPIRHLVRKDPDIYPGFYTLPTPDKNAKRLQLDRVMKTITQTVGSTVFDSRTNMLVKPETAEGDASSIEKEILAAHTEPVERIGVGLALGMFRRARWGREFRAGRKPFEGTRGASLVRERPEFAGAQLSTLD
jgi:hypothetical protein